MKPLILALLIALSFSAVQAQKLNPRIPNINIKERYDRFSDITSVTLLIKVIDDGPRTLELAVHGAAKGKDTTTATPRVVLLVTSISADWLYLRSPNLCQAILDGETRVTLGDMKRINSEVRTRGRGVIEQLELEVPFSVLEKLSKATKLEMRIGSDEFVMSDGQLSDIREWADHFPAAKSGVKPAVVDH